MSDRVEVLAAEVEAHHALDHAATDGELAILAGLAAGDSYTQIARQQGITVDAARQRAGRAARKLHAQSVVHAVAIAVQHGLITGAEA